MHSSWLSMTSSWTGWLKLPYIRCACSAAVVSETVDDSDQISTIHIQISYHLTNKWDLFEPSLPTILKSESWVEYRASHGECRAGDCSTVLHTVLWCVVGSCSGPLLGVSLRTRTSGEIHFRFFFGWPPSFYHNLFLSKYLPPYISISFAITMFWQRTADLLKQNSLHHFCDN